MWWMFGEEETDWSKLLVSSLELNLKDRLVMIVCYTMRNWDYYSNCWHGCKLKQLNCSEAGEMQKPEIENYFTHCACDLILFFVSQFFKDGRNPAWTVTRTSTCLLMSSNWIKQETTTLSLVFCFLSLSRRKRHNMGTTDRLGVYMRVERLCVCRKTLLHSPVLLASEMWTGCPVYNVNDFGPGLSSVHLRPSFWVFHMP